MAVTNTYLIGAVPDLLAPLSARSKGGQSSPLVLLSLGLDLRRREFLAVVAGARGREPY